MTPNQWLLHLKEQHTKPAWIGVDTLFEILQGKKVHLTGHAGEFDVLFNQKSLKSLLMGKNGDGEKFSPMGAFELSGHVFIAVVNPQDGYRSSLDQLLYVPGAKLQTHLPNVPVHLELGSSAGWDNPKSNKEYPQFFSFVSVATNKSVLDFGTEANDSYYPSGRFGFDMAELQKAIPPASLAELARATRSAKKAASAKPKHKM